MPKEYRQHRFVPPENSTSILLVRHGESSPASSDKPFPLVDGHGDPALHPDGEIQAQKVAEFLENEDIAAIYVSNLRRTLLTATPLAERLGLKPVVLADLREVYLGDWEGGVYREKVDSGHSLFREARRMNRWDVIPNAEPNEEFESRVLGAIQEIASSHQGSLVAAFVHGGVIGQIVASATGAKPFSFLGADNGSITRIVVVRTRIIVRSFNEVSHLG